MPTGNVEPRHLEVEKQLLVATHLQLSSSSTIRMDYVDDDYFTVHVLYHSIYILNVKITLSIAYHLHLVFSFRSVDGELNSGHI